MTTLSEWLAAVTNNDSMREMARRLDVDHTTLRRTIKGNAVHVIFPIARIYGANPIDGLLAAEVITPEDLAKWHARTSLNSYTDRELSLEILRRVEEREARDLTNPLEGDGA